MKICKFNEENRKVRVNVLSRYSDEESSTSSRSYLIGLMPVKSSPMTQQTLSNDHLVNQSPEQHNTIRSSVDIVSLNSSMTSSIPPIGKQLNQQEEQEEEEEEYYMIVNSPRSRVQCIMNHHENDIEEEELMESTKLYDNGQYDGTASDESQQSDDLRLVLLFHAKFTHAKHTGNFGIDPNLSGE